MQKDKANISSIISLLAGACIGYIIAAFTLPKIGIENREDIKSKIEDVKENAKESVESKSKVALGTIKNKLLGNDNFYDEAKKLSQNYTKQLEELAKKYEEK